VLKYVYNWVGLDEQIVESTEPVPTGHVVLSASFEREGDAMPPAGTLTLHIRDQAVGEGRIKTQPELGHDRLQSTVHQCANLIEHPSLGPIDDT
jgi:hypothetical protein